MTTTTNKTPVSRYYDEVLTQRNLAALDELLAPDFASWLPDGTRLTEHWEEIDQLRLMRQLGVLG